MLVKVAYFSDRLAGGIVGQLICSGCGKLMDLVSQQEVLSLMSGNYGPPVCGECEKKTCRVCGHTYQAKSFIKEISITGGVCTLCVKDELTPPGVGEVVELTDAGKKYSRNLLV